MEDITDNTLGYRRLFTKNSNSDIFLSLASIFLTVGSCIEDTYRLSGPIFCFFVAETAFLDLKKAYFDCLSLFLHIYLQLFITINVL